jgi:hypothetical protein
MLSSIHIQKSKDKVPEIQDHYLKIKEKRMGFLPYNLANVFCPGMLHIFSFPR